jgi:hypothetical protein
MSRLRHSYLPFHSHVCCPVVWNRHPGLVRGTHKVKLVAEILEVGIEPTILPSGGRRLIH